VAAVVVVAAATASTVPRESARAARCVGGIARMKTLSDRDRRLVRLRARATTIPMLAQAPPPRPIPTRRRTPFQRRAWQVVAQIVQYRLLRDGTVELILFDGGSYVRAGMPSPKCLSRASRARRAIIAARAQFVAVCGEPGAEFRDLGAIAYVSGVGFWSRRRLVSQAAPNAAELQPVTSLRLIAGCR
jgi:hypothetical protein